MNNMWEIWLFNHFYGVSSIIQVHVIIVMAIDVKMCFAFCEHNIRYIRWKRWGTNICSFVSRFRFMKLKDHKKYNPSWNKMFLLLLLKIVGSVWPRESDWHPISPKTLDLQKQPIYKERRLNENNKRQKGSEQNSPVEKYWPSSLNSPIPRHRTQGHQDRSTLTIRKE